MLTTKPISFCKSDPNQPRKQFDQSALMLLAASMKSLGQLQPIGVKADGTIIWGERRFRAAQLAGLKELTVIITDRHMSDSEIRLIQLTENMLRSDLSGYEKWMGCAELMSLNPQWGMKDLADHLHLDPSMVTRLLSPSKCIAAVQEALAAGKVDISSVYAISKLPESDQPSMLALKLSGASRDTIEQAGRKKRGEESPSVKMSRIRAVLSSGVCIIASGEGLSLDDFIESLNEAQKEAKKAREQGLDAKTFSAVMRDKAKRATV